MSESTPYIESGLPQPTSSAINLSRRRKAFFTLILFCFAACTALIAAEIYVRLTSAYGYITPETLRAMTPDYQPAVFARYVIQQKAKSVIVNGEEQFRINSHGYRGRDFTINKPEGVIRIMFYGGSSVFDAESPNDDDWPHHVERVLKADGFSHVESINAGIPGYSSGEAVGTLFAEGHLFSPDYVLLYDEWNDIKLFSSTTSLLREFTRSEASDDPRTTYQNGLDWLLSNVSQLYVRVRGRYYAWKLRLGDEGIRPVGEYSSTIPDEALKQYKLNVETFVDIARNIGAVPILMIEARLVTRDNTSAEKSRINYDYVLLTHDALCTAFEMQDKIIYDVAREKGVLVIDASRHLTGRDDLFANHIHLNREGSAQLAKLVADELALVLRERK